MDDEDLASFLQTGSFRVTGDCYVIATNSGSGHGNTVAQCFPLRCPDDRVISAGQVATRVADALNELMRQNDILKDG